MLINYHKPKNCPECKSTKLSTATLEQNIDTEKGAQLIYWAPLMICDDCGTRFEQPIVEHMREVFADWMVDLNLNRRIPYESAH